jgi:TonB family protein
MAPLIPCSSSPPPPASDARVPGPTRFVPSDEIVRQSDATILATLRQVVAAGTEQTETIMGAIAEAARSLSGATGAAIAMPRGDAVECVGRSGQAAPELGARLNVDSGISGECLRTGKILRCDDASRNLHVDAEVCRRLGLQSIVAVPLRGKQHGRVGVLEVFSSRPYAFDDGDTDMLGRLAGLAETAWAQGSSIQVPSEAEPTSKEQSHSGVGGSASFTLASMAALARIGEALSAWPHDKLQTELKRRYMTIGVTVLVVLILSSVMAWRAWYKASPVPTSLQHPIEQRSSAQLPNDSVEGDLARRPGSGHHVSRPHVASAVHVLKSTAGRQKPGSPIQRPNNRSHMNTETSAPTPRADEVPEIAASSARADIESALSTAPAAPELSAPISQGVTGGILQHKVPPVYPLEARRVRLEGNVVLEAMVTAQGRVEDLKVISGNPLLAQAAMHAVNQWRYTPYLLNGEPVRKEIRITISFVAEQ